MKLAVLKGFQNEGNVVISCVPYAIGRCRSADFIIAHVNVSRNHCKIIKEHELWKVYDFSSSGTFVNDILVGQGKSIVLNKGDRLRFGPLESNLCWTFYSFDAAGEDPVDSSNTPETQIFHDCNEKYFTKEKHSSSKVNDLSVSCKENEILEESNEVLGHFDLKFNRTNEKLLQEKETNICKIQNESQNSKESSQFVKEKKVQEMTESEKIKELTKELQQVRKALSNLEEKNCVFQRELTVETNSKTASSPNANLLENLTDLMEAELQCTICSELFVTAVTLSCTHTFCKYCINQWKRKQKTCPICRKKITNETRSLVVDNYIDKMVGNLSLELKERREAIIKERNEVGPHRKRPKLRN